MSTDWFLFSPSKKTKAMVGSDGFSGVKVWPTEYGGHELLRWAIENNITDVVLVNENSPLLYDDESDSSFHLPPPS